MHGLMMDFPLTLTYMLERARRLFPQKEIATRTADGMHRYTYADFAARAARLANALSALGIRPGDRVATFAWNSYRHLELYFAVPCSGGVLHTVNIRLHPEQLIYVINHAEDRLIFADAALLPVLAPIRDQFKTVEKIVVLDETPSTPALDADKLNYESLLAGVGPDIAWPRLEENHPAIICYTSGTTGNPKGVVYTHRALFLHSMGLAMADTFALSESDRVMPVVPMFHANCWGIPFACTMLGATQVYTGPFLQPRDLADLIQGERVTVTLGVPTIWTDLLHLLEQSPINRDLPTPINRDLSTPINRDLSTSYDFSSLRMMIVGGSAAPRSLIEKYEKQFGVSVLHAWGMTETSPLGTVCRLRSSLAGLNDAERFQVKASQGLPVAGVELRTVDESGNEIPWDGKTFGEVQVRGPWIASGYYNDDRTREALSDGWFRTGDVATISPDGYMQIADRTKDLIKSGGEWISSVDLENAIMNHPKVLEACVIAVPHPKWGERPLACVVPKPEFKDRITPGEISNFLKPIVAKWWLPDAIEFIEAVPKTSVGKFDKKVLRQRFSDYHLPADS